MENPKLLGKIAGFIAPESNVIAFYIVFFRIRDGIMHGQGIAFHFFYEKMIAKVYESRLGGKEKIQSCSCEQNAQGEQDVFVAFGHKNLQNIVATIYDLRCQSLTENISVC